MEAARVCPTHRLVLDELEDGRLHCPWSPHRVTAWLVVDVETGEILGAGRVVVARNEKRPPAGIWLGPGLRFGAGVLLDLEPRRFALPVAALPPAA